MSETETRDDVKLRQRHLRQICTDAAAARAERDEAEAEAQRLRGVVEAVWAVADEWECEPDGPGRWSHRQSCPSCWRADRLRAVLASVPSSGETESGTARLIDPTLAAPPLEDLLRGSEFEGALPAPASPEPTGADGLCLNCFAQGVRAGREEADGRIAAALVARPVLSREAVREQLDGHWLEGDHCTCDDWRADPKSCFSNRTQWRDHLAAVLVGQEER
jgi:hypothetical protein